MAQPNGTYCVGGRGNNSMVRELYIQPKSVISSLEYVMTINAYLIIYQKFLFDDTRMKKIMLNLKRE